MLTDMALDHRLGDPEHYADLQAAEAMPKGAAAGIPTSVH